MTEFRQRIEAPVEEAPLQAPETPVKLTENPNGENLKDVESTPNELEVWETENKRKYSVDYFNAKALSADFNTKMLLAKVDKFIKAELEEKQYAKTTYNYQNLLTEIENYLGSSRMELYSRLNKIIGYIDVINKEKSLKKLKESYARGSSPVSH